MKKIWLATIIVLSTILLVACNTTGGGSSNLKTYYMGNISFTDTTYEYDGLEKTLTITGDLPDGVSVSYTKNRLKEIGSLEVIASFTGSSEYNKIPEMKATLTITKKTLSGLDIRFESREFIYDGSLKYLEVTGDIPSGISVSYENNGISIGTVEVTAKFESAIYYIAEMKATLTIKLQTYYEDNYLFVDFGTYPQTVVTDEYTISNLDSISEVNEKGYIEYNDGEYAKETSLRSGTFVSSGTRFVRGNEYYFKVEPIKWRILEGTDHDVLLMSEYILDSSVYKDYDEWVAEGQVNSRNNYEHSTIRNWLNNDFFDQAFDTNLQSYILETLVDNSAYSTGQDDNPFASNDTLDKVFLLSFEELTNEGYGFSSNRTDYDVERRTLPTDMAYSSRETYGGSVSYYWTRSPYYHSGYTNGHHVCTVNFTGYVYDSDGFVRLQHGVRPALRISIN